MAVDPKAEIQAALKKAIEKEAPGQNAERIYALERPRQASHGDYASSAALQLTKILKKNPRELAQSLSTSIQALLPPGLATLSIEGPGFINFRLTAAPRPTWFATCSRPVNGTGIQRKKPPCRCRSSSCPPIPPARCTSAMAGRRRSATRSLR
jgi:arginyl-tRNA synthetase